MVVHDDLARREEFIGDIEDQAKCAADYFGEFDVGDWYVNIIGRGEGGGALWY